MRRGRTAACRRHDRRGCAGACGAGACRSPARTRGGAVPAEPTGERGRHRHRALPARQGALAVLRRRGDAAVRASPPGNDFRVEVFGAGPRRPGTRPTARAPPLHRHLPRRARRVARPSRGARRCRSAAARAARSGRVHERRAGTRERLLARHDAQPRARPRGGRGGALPRRQPLLRADRVALEGGELPRAAGEKGVHGRGDRSSDRAARTAGRHRQHPDGSGDRRRRRRVEARAAASAREPLSPGARCAGAGQPAQGGCQRGYRDPPPAVRLRGTVALDALAPSEIKATEQLFFSHLHMDHVGGFDTFFRSNFDRAGPARDAVGTARHGGDPSPSLPWLLVEHRQRRARYLDRPRRARGPRRAVALRGARGIRERAPRSSRSGTAARFSRRRTSPSRRSRCRITASRSATSFARRRAR